MSTPFSPTPTIAAVPGHERQRRVDDRAALVEHEPRDDAALAAAIAAIACGGVAVGLLVAAEREVDVARGREAGGEQVLDGLEDRRSSGPLSSSAPRP